MNQGEIKDVLDVLYLGERVQEQVAVTRRRRGVSTASADVIRSVVECRRRMSIVLAGVVDVMAARYRQARAVCADHTRRSFTASCLIHTRPSRRQRPINF